MSVEIDHYNGLATELVWPIASQWLQELDRRADDIQSWDLYEEVVSGTSVLFLVSVDGEHKAAAVGTLNVTSKKRVFWITAMGGENMPAWIGELSDDIAQFAESVGAESVGCAARPGVAARLRNLERPQRWRRGVTYMTLELKNGQAIRPDQN